jgi:hypothetical protein
MSPQGPPVQFYEEYQAATTDEDRATMEAKWKDRFPKLAEVIKSEAAAMSGDVEIQCQACNAPVSRKLAPEGYCPQCNRE